jgi:hypothetical protein
MSAVVDRLTRETEIRRRLPQLRLRVLSIAQGRPFVSPTVPRLNELLQRLSSVPNLTSPTLSGFIDGCQIGLNDVDHLNAAAGIESPGLDFGGFPISTAVTQTLREGLLAYAGHIHWIEAVTNVGVKVASVGACAAIGGGIGTFLFPGVGTFVGSALGGWLGGFGGQAFVEREVNRARKSYVAAKDEWYKRAEMSRVTSNDDLQQATALIRERYFCRLAQFTYFHRRRRISTRRMAILGLRIFDRVSRSFASSALVGSLRIERARRLREQNCREIKTAREHYRIARSEYCVAQCRLQEEFNSKLEQHARVICAMVKDLNNRYESLRKALRKRGRG